MKPVNFTETRVKALAAPAGQRLDIPDAEITGLRLRVSAPNSKGDVSRSWNLLQRVHGKLTRVTIGKWPAVTVDTARKRAKVLQGQITEGRNPSDEKKRRRKEGRTLGEAFEAYLDVRRLKLKPNTVRQYRDDYRMTLEPWAKRQLSTITRGDVQKMHRERSEVSPSRADGAMRLLSAIMNWAGDELADDPANIVRLDNPTKRLGAQKLWNNPERRQTMIPLPRIGDWLEAALEDHSSRMSHYLVFLLMTGTRRREAESLEWSAVDLELGAFTLRAEDVKGNRTVTLPLPAQLIALLRIRRAVTPKPVKYVFGNAANGKHVADPRRALARIGAASGTYVTSHDLRRTFATVGETVGVPAYTLKTLLNHARQRSDVTAGYVVQDVEALRPWCQRIADQMFGQLEPDASKVIPFARPGIAG